MKALTERQEQVLACIRQTIGTHGEAPTVREIGDHVGLSSSSHYQLKQLERHGVIARGESRWRPYRLA
ncbi:LexA family protein [Streptomyces sp. NPDC055287]